MPVTIESYITYYPPPCNRHSSSYRHPRLPRVLHQWLRLCAAPLTRSPPRARRARPQRTKYTGTHIHCPQHLSNHPRGALRKRNRPALWDREDLQHVPLRLRRRATGQAPQTEPLHLAAPVDGGCIHGVRDARVARGHPDLLRHQRSRERARPHCSAPTSSPPRTSLCARRRHGPGLALSSSCCGRTASVTQRPCVRSLRA